MPLSLAEIVARLGGDLVGDADLVIASVATLEEAGPSAITFLANPKYRSKLAATRAAAVILAPEMARDCPVAAIVTPQPYLYFARLAQWLYPRQPPVPGIHPSAVIESPIPSTVSIGPGVWIGRDVTIGEHTVVDAHCRLGCGASVGSECWLHAGVTIYDRCSLGDRSIVHAGVVIGSDGFGFARESTGNWVKIPQVGRVIIGSDVEIGANTTIDRGAIEDTVIEDGVKLDNQIQVAHNVRIGAHSALAGCVGIAGSARIGQRCTIGGGAVILGHLELADGVHVSAGTLVSKTIAKAGSYTGTVPFMAHDDWLKNFARLRHLEAMADKIRALETRLAELEKKQ